LLGFVTKHACDRRTDGGRTDEQNYYSQDHASIAASRGKHACKVTNESTLNTPCETFAPIDAHKPLNVLKNNDIAIETKGM